MSEEKVDVKKYCASIIIELILLVLHKIDKELFVIKSCLSVIFILDVFIHKKSAGAAEVC